MFFYSLIFKFIINFFFAVPKQLLNPSNGFKNWNIVDTHWNIQIWSIHVNKSCICIYLWNHTSDQGIEYFSYPRIFPCVNCLPSFCPSGRSSFFFYDFYVPKSTPQHFLTIKKEITKYFCCLANFNNLNVVLGLPMLLYVSIFQPFYFWGVFHYMNVSQFIYPFFCSWILIWSFPEWPIVNNLSMNWINVLNFLQYTTNNGITMSTY